MEDARELLDLQLADLPLGAGEECLRAEPRAVQGGWVAARPGARLFRGLVRRLDWRDPSSAPAREHGEEHAVVLARIEVEDWLDALRRETADPDGTAAATALAPAGRTERLPASGRFDAG